jgi:hypothetical protein
MSESIFVMFYITDSIAEIARTPEFSRESNESCRQLMMHSMATALGVWEGGSKWGIQCTRHRREVGLASEALVLFEKSSVVTSVIDATEVSKIERNGRSIN